MAAMDVRIENLEFPEEDIQYEEEILRNAYSVKHWLRYLEHKAKSPYCQVNTIFERALKELPGSYKIWYNYLRTRRNQVRGLPVSDVKYEEANNCFERALVFMHKMPRIWIDYCIFMTNQLKITRTRHLFDRALRALPITQHHRIWPLYLKFAKRTNIPETAIKIYRRYLKLFPDDVEELIEYLVEQGKLDDAAQRLATIVDNENFVSKHGKSNHQLWNELCELMSKNPSKVHSLNVDAIIRGGLTRYTDQLSRLWNSLADYYVRSGLFDRARDIYEEAIQTVTTVRDFTQVFDEYAQFEELSLSKRMENITHNQNTNEEDDIEIELRLSRFEYLMERRLLLLNSVLLRQNPHNVPEWHKRVKLYDSKPHEIINTYTEAVQTVQPKLAIGRVNTLWIEFAKFYEKNGQIEDARVVFEKATGVDYTKVDELANVWCEWAEMEIRQKKVTSALKLMQKATFIPKKKVDYSDDTVSVQDRLYKSLKVWSMYADLEESFGTFKTCKSVYDQIIDLRICTPQIIINYGLFLEEHGYFEEAFRAYEKGISLFKWPNVYDIWNAYLTKFLKRYGGSKLERARDLFEQCLENCPPDIAKYFYLLYAKLEEEHGLARHAMAVYNRATTAVKSEEMFDMFNIFIRKAADIYGLPRTREIYERAIEVLPEGRMRDMCIRFAEMETKLGEIDRARTIYAHCSQVSDPRITAEFWQTWKDFEVRHGNEDTMREMLRIKRAVQATYNTQINMMTAQLSHNTVEKPYIDGMKMLDTNLSEISGKLIEKNINIAFVRGEIQGISRNEHDINPDEIDISDTDEEDSEKNDDGCQTYSSEGAATQKLKLERQEIPKNVFKGFEIPKTKKYTDQLSRLWNSLADYYVRSGLFDRARDIYEEAIQTVTTVRDFTQVFDEYAQFEELSLSKRMENITHNQNTNEEDDIEIELRLSRFEYLMERRLLLLNSVLLRQNPHNVPEWHKRVKLYDSKPHEIINTYTEAVQTVQPKLAIGRVNTLWIEFAKFYEKNGQIEDARVVFEKATGVDYTKVDELANVWCEWAEMEIRQKKVTSALKLMQKATFIPKKKVDYSDDTVSVQDRLYKSLKVWSMYADLEESFGTFKTCKSVYDQIIDLRICTPQIIINYGLFLEEHGYFEEAFRAYEKGISLFKWPNVYDIWNAYLTKFLKRYGGSKLERARDLFEQCLENCPPDIAKYFYLLYAKLEEEHGLARHAMAVYNRATTAVKSEEMFDMFNIFIRKAADIYGLPRTREIYERAIEVLPEGRMRDMCIRFAEMETKLGEIDRARTIYAHCSQVSDPRITAEFWQTWKDFEVRHGNEDTMREMLRIKRAVQATYNTQINMMTAQLSHNTVEKPYIDGMKMLDTNLSEISGKLIEKNINIAFVRGEIQGISRNEHDINPDEIDISDTDEEDSEKNDDGCQTYSSEGAATQKLKLERQEIPKNVFKGFEIPKTKK